MKVNYSFSLGPAPAVSKPIQTPTDPAELPFPIPPEIWSIPPFAMVAIPGFECVSTQSPVTFSHPAGHTAIITVRKVEGAPSADQSAQVVAATLTEINELVERLKTQYSGRVAIENFQIPDGVQLFAARANPLSFGSAKYFLLYAAIAPKGHLSLVTIEGPGEVRTMAAKYDPHVKAVHFAT